MFIHGLKSVLVSVAVIVCVKLTGYVGREVEMATVYVCSEEVSGLTCSFRSSKRPVLATDKQKLKTTTCQRLPSFSACGWLTGKKTKAPTSVLPRRWWSSKIVRKREIKRDWRDKMRFE